MRGDFAPADDHRSCACARATRSVRTAALLLALSASLVTPPARAQDDKSGVSPSRLKLPKGPGSIEGIGENAEPNLSMGLLTYAVGIELPQGYPGATPSLRLVYSSGSGNSEVGIGWSLPVASIERMTSKGLPRYDASDLFAAGGSDELVRIHASGVYRARYESGFVRYSFVDPDGSGKRGYFIASYPDGRTGYFGAHADGALEESARVEGPDGTFRYQLVETVDPLGHAVLYEYRPVAGYPTLSRIAYGFPGEGRRDPRYEVVLEHEARPDEISDARPGFDLRLVQRLRAISVRVRGVQLRRYAFGYHAATSRTFLSRLAHVEHFGAEDTGPHPIDFRFEYSGGDAESACSGPSCDSTEVIDVERRLGIDFSSNADLLDINGDGLPDVLHTPSGEAHRFFVNELTPEGAVAWSAAQSSDIGSMQLQEPSVQTVDLDGDGFTDLLNTSNGDGSALVYWNRGNGDWHGEQTVDELGLPDFANARNLRFFDYDNDKRPDLLHDDGSSAYVYAHRTDSTFVEDHDVESLGQDLTTLQLADMNGDGMQDAVQLAYGLLAYRLNLGFGRWSGWIQMTEAPEVSSGLVRVVDINGDGPSDVVMIFADQVRYALNRSGRSFAAPVSIDVPETASGSSVRFADLNGSGSVDVVWITPNGRVSYLELFRTRPNLLTSITTGAGKVIEAQYGSSILHMARAKRNGVPWLHRLPNPVLTVDTLTTYDTLSNVRQTRRFEYRDGYYDGEEKQFRGFETVSVEVDGDRVTDEDGVTTFVEGGVTTHQFDVGREDSYKKGLLKRRIVRSAERTLREERHDYGGDCAIDDILDIDLSRATPPVRYLCQTGTTTEVFEGLPDGVTLREEYEYDAFGNRTVTTNHGVVDMPNSATCSREAEDFGAPCGDEWLGDETIQRTDFVPPSSTGGRWLLNKPYRKRQYGRRGSSTFRETRFYYDGDAFDGLPLGELTRGLLARTEARVDVERWIPTERVKHDAHGNPIEVRDAEGRRRRFGYDPTGLFLTSEEVVLESGASLRMTASHHPLFDTIIAASSWMFVEPSGASSAPRNTSFAYDAFGRLSKTAQPGDSLELPTETYRYDLDDPISRIVRRARSRSGGDLDVEEVQCFDGLGRMYQTRSRIEGSRYQVSGYKVFDLHGNTRQEYQPFTAEGGACDSSAPASVGFGRTSYDATGRAVEVTQSDADLYETPSVTRTRYEPLRTTVFDPEDSDPSSPHAATPELTIRDGLGRVTGIERLLSPEERVHLELTYDELGNLSGYTQRHDGAHIVKRQVYDLLGRVSSVDDPDSGVTTFTYDDVGNTIAETDARGITTRSSFDAANRLVTQWERGRKEATRIDYSYDALDGCEACTNLPGQLARVRFPMGGEESANHGEDVLGYDVRSRPVYSRRTLDGHAFELRTELDNLGRVVARQYPTGLRVERAVDGLGRLSSVPGYVPEVRYESRGLPTVLAFGNGVITTQVYDRLNRLEHLETRGPDGTLLQSYRYERDRVGNILSIDDESASGDDVPSANARYEYDSWYRLTAAHLDVGRVAEEHLEFGYDAFDRITHKTSSAGEASPDHVGDYEYRGTDGAGFHAATHAGVSVRYDAAGNAVLRGNDTYEWDFLGRLTRATRGNTVLGEYEYGPDRGRVKKTEGGIVTYYVTPDFEVRGGIATSYILLGDRRVARIVETRHAGDTLGDWAPGVVNGTTHRADPDGETTSGDAYVAAQLLSGQYLSILPPPPATDRNLLLASDWRLLDDETGNRLEYFHHSHLGSTAAITDARGRSLEQRQYYPYGLIRFATTNSSEPYTNVGKETDATGLQQSGARYADPVSATWLSPDPLNLTWRGDTPIFRRDFVAHNPVRFHDPTGTKEQDEAGATKNWVSQKLQNRISSIDQKVATGAKLTTVDRLFLRALYGTMAVGGQFAGTPEAAALMWHYQYGSGPKTVPSQLYTESSNVKARIENRWKQIIADAQDGSITTATRTGKKFFPEKGNKRLYYANNTLRLQSHATLSDNEVTVVFSIADTYGFRKEANFFTPIKKWGVDITIPDRVSRQLEAEGMAESFEYKGEWTERRQLPEASQ